MKPVAPRLSPDAGPCILVTQEELTRFAGTDVQGIAIFGLVTVGDDVIGLVDAAGERFDLRTAPMLCLGFVGLSPGAVARLETARVVLESWSTSDFPAPALLRPDQLDSGLPLLLSTSLVGRVQAYAAHVTRLSRELFRLRAAHEDMLNAFATVENFISSSGVQPCNMTFENPPDIDRSAVSMEATAVTQVLPVSTMGLSVIQIHVGDWTASRQRVGGIGVELRTIEDHEIHGTWAVPLDRLQPGWVTLSLSGGLTGLQRTPELVIRPLGGLGLLPPLSLGAMQPIAGFRPRLAGRSGVEVEPRSLALRTWSGIPGVRPPAVGHAADLEQADEAGGVRDYAIPFTLLRDVEHVRQDWRPDFAPVDYLPEIRGLLCHPPEVGATWAALADFPAAEQPFRLSVRAIVRSPEARPIEFGFAFSTLPPDVACPDMEAAAAPVQRGDLVFSGWRRVTHEDPAVLSVLVHGCADRQGRLYFGTRMEESRGNDFAWASFYNLRKTVLGSDAAQPPRLAQMPQDAIKAGTPDPVIVLEGVPLSLATLEGVEDAQEPWLEGLPTIHYDRDRRGIFCHPPPSGIALARLSTLRARDTFKLLARLHVANDRSEPVDFALIVAALPPEAVLQRLVAGTVRRSDDDVVWSGWETVGYGRDIVATVNTLPLRVEQAEIFLATRMSGGAASNDFAWAYFMDIRVVSQTGAVQAPSLALS